MKKLIVILLCVFGIKVVNAEGLVCVYLPYYIKINDEVIRVKRVKDTISNDFLFNLNIDNYELTSNFDKDKVELNKNMSDFNSIVYYGFNNEQTNLNYFLTQYLIWEKISNYDISIVDKYGNIVTTYNDLLKEIKEKIDNHEKDSSFFNKTFKSLVGENNIFTYESLILDNPVIDGLEIETTNNQLNIIGKKEGNYTINLKKDYEEENYIYSDGKNIYYSSLKGPADINKSFILNIEGIKLNIKENIIGVNDKYGDALIDSKYELYLKDELNNIISNLESPPISPNSSYILKDISNSIGINKVDDITFDVLNEDYELIINKYVINKKIKLNIDYNDKYYVYLKSNNELYNVISKDVDSIILPYGLYYIVSEDKEYYQEVEVYDELEEVLNIGKEEVVNDLNNDIVENDNTIDNPKTFDNLYLSLFMFCISSGLFLFLISMKKHI